MTTNAPKIDKRTINDLVDQVENLAAQYTELPDIPSWKPRPRGEGDVGRALIKIFARMTEQVIERLNQVPEKNFLAFLDLIGTRMSPPRPSRVPLTFALSAGSTTGAIVPAGTMVSAPPGKGDDEEVIFETERELVLTQSEPVAALSRNPTEDGWGDVSGVLSGTNEHPVMLFTADRHINHKLYLAQTDIFTLPGPKKVVISVKSSDAPALSKLPLQWSCWDGTDWHVLSTVSKLDKDACWKITMLDPPIPEFKTINNKNAPWIFAQLKTNLPADEPSPVVNQITAHYEVGEKDLLPEFGFTDVMPLDISKDFFPFGEQPGFNTTFYIGCRQAFSRKNARVEIQIKLTNLGDPNAIPPPADPSPDLRLAWEFWNTHNEQWQALDEPDPEAKDRLRYKFIDNTGTFKGEGSIVFDCPEEIGPVEVNGQLSYWIRVRIVAGDYGKPASTEKVEAILKPNLFRKLKIPMYEVIPATYRPPSIQSMTVDYTHSSEPTGMDEVISENDSNFEDHLPDAAAELKSFRPYTPGKERYRALYLGFNKPFGNQPVTLYAGVNEKARDQSSPAASKLIWEYSSRSRNGWTTLWVEDETGGFTETGLIRFIGPREIVSRRDFGREAYWLRLRQEDSETPISPRLRCLLVNTAWASQVNTIHNELMGSSTGEPDQVFHLLRAPVLESPHITVREQESPAGIKLENLHGEEKPDAIIPAPNSNHTPGETWNRWREVANFFGSGPRDRHFVVDHLTGEVRFGNGRHGLIPPQDRNNIRARKYRTGGGKRGNLPAGTITQLKRTIPYVDGVFNYEASSGGAEQESLENVKRFGPRTLRHRNRAVTLQDFEDLTYGAFADVARVAVISPRYHPANRKITAGEVQSTGNPVDIILVPRGTDPRPEPSRGLENQVHNYLAARCAPTVKLQICGADWVKVSVETSIAPVSLQMAGGLGQKVTDAVKRFLHPLHGGFDNRGWDFGRIPYRSDLYALIEPIEGVDYVQHLRLTADPRFDLIPVERLQRVLIFSGDHRIEVVPPEEGV